MIWLFRATQVVTLTYRLILAAMMTAYLIREGLNNAQQQKVQRQLPPPETSPT